jgi:hypothetical protein
MRQSSRKVKNRESREAGSELSSKAKEVIVYGLSQPGFGNFISGSIYNFVVVLLEKRHVVFS